MTEKIFIAWERNRELAESVAKNLHDNHKYDVIVGDELDAMSIDPKSAQCTQFVILIDKLVFTDDEKSSGKREARTKNCRNNIMFEWAYFAGRDKERLSVFFINERGNFPKELMDCHTKRIPILKDMAPKKILIDNLANEIVKEFTVRSRQSANTMDKFEIFSSWPELKRRLISKTVQYSELELAHRLLHSIDPSYYYMDDLSSCLSDLRPNSGELYFVCDLIKVNAELFKDTDGLKKPLNETKISTFKRKFNRSEYVPSNEDENFNLWLVYFCEIRLALVCWLEAKSKSDSDKRGKKNALESAMVSLNKANDALEKISASYPTEQSYVKLYKGYLYYDGWLIKNLSRIVYEDDLYTKEANDYITKAMVMFEDFNELYKDLPLRDKFLVKYFEAEYHTRRLNGMETSCFSGDVKKNEINDAIYDFIKRIDYTDELSLLRELRQLHLCEAHKDRGSIVRNGKEEPPVSSI